MKRDQCYLADKCILNRFRTEACLPTKAGPKTETYLELNFPTSYYFLTFFSGSKVDIHTI